MTEDVCAKQRPSRYARRKRPEREMAGDRHATDANELDEREHGKPRQRRCERRHDDLEADVSDDREEEDEAADSEEDAEPRARALRLFGLGQSAPESSSLARGTALDATSAVSGPHAAVSPL